jgi:hypothetical protein
VQWAPGIPHALQGGEKFSNDSGATRREIAKPYLMNTNAPHPQPSSPATGLAEGETRWRGITVLDGAGVTLFPDFACVIRPFEVPRYFFASSIGRTFSGEA